jgi:hypothetical protein
MSHLDNNNNVEHKHDITTVEDSSHQVPDQQKGEPYVAISNLSGLTRWNATKKSWKVSDMGILTRLSADLQVVLFCFMVSFGATLDGFHMTIPGVSYTHDHL